MVFGGVAIGEIGYAEDPPTAYDAYAASVNGLGAYVIATDTWTDITPDPDSPDNGPAVIMVTGVGSDIWASTGNFVPKLFHSADNGTSWAQVTTPGTGDGTIDSLRIAGTDIIAAINDDSSEDNGLWICPADGSGSWTRIANTGISFAWCGDIVGSRIWIAKNVLSIRHFGYITPANIGGLFNDGSLTGASGTLVEISAVPTDESIAFAMVGHDVALGGPKLYRFNDATGTDITPPGLSSASVSTFDGIVSSDGSIVLVVHHEANTSNGHKIYRSTNGGSSWTTVYTGTSSLGFHSCLKLSPTVAGRVIARDDGTLLISDDLGLTWSASIPCDPTTSAITAVWVL